MFARRSYMLDISRDRVPTMETLFLVVDILAKMRYNEFQLYTEHTFAYKGHETVWRDADPMTPGEIASLERYCEMQGIELVPNQNTFGHMERWLVHDEYRPLAKFPNGGAMTDTVFRVGHIGCLTERDYDQLIDAFLDLRKKGFI